MRYNEVRVPPAPRSRSVLFPTLVAKLTERDPQRPGLPKNFPRDSSPRSFSPKPERDRSPRERERHIAVPKLCLPDLVKMAGLFQSFHGGLFRQPQEPLLMEDKARSHC